MADMVYQTLRQTLQGYRLSKMEPIPSWNMKYVQRYMKKIKDEHKTAVE